MQLFYNPEITSNTQQITFDKIESRHIVRVLRKKEGDVLHITNGKNILFEAAIIIADDKKCVANITSFQEKSNPRNYYLHIAIAPTKNNDRLEWFLEKATEIGVDEITPIICQNSERRILKLDRLEKIVQAAMKQSLKFILPKINKPVKFTDFINQELSDTICIAHCEEGEKKSLREVIKPTDKVTILIGPEGDFSSEEIKTAKSKKITPITLGDSRLRTETAALTVVSHISFINQ